jgi:Ca2+-binding EF-hand superfamily protein
MKITRSLPILAALGLAACTTPSDKDLYREADKNKDGRLTLAEVNAVGLPRLFNRYDTNGDGSVTLEEARSVDPGFPEKEFSSRDLNKDGKVTYAEYDKVAQARGGLKKQFSAIDTNHDGYIDKAEADAYVAKMEATPAAH